MKFDDILHSVVQKWPDHVELEKEYSKAGTSYIVRGLFELGEQVEFAAGFDDILTLMMNAAVIGVLQKAAEYVTGATPSALCRDAIRMRFETSLSTVSSGDHMSWGASDVALATSYFAHQPSVN